MPEISLPCILLQWARPVYRLNIWIDFMQSVWSLANMPGLSLVFCNFLTLTLLFLPWPLMLLLLQLFLRLNPWSNAVDHEFGPATLTKLSQQSSSAHVSCSGLWVLPSLCYMLFFFSVPEPAPESHATIEHSLASITFSLPSFLSDTTQ